MSRSRKKTPIGGNATGSERFDKQMWHRRLRNQEKRRLERGELEEHVAVDKKEVSDVWLMKKDGKSRFFKEGLTVSGLKCADLYYKWIGK